MENILSIKENYIGGVLSYRPHPYPDKDGYFDPNGIISTEIKDIIIKADDENHNFLFIIGKDFNYQFHLNKKIEFKQLENALLIKGKHESIWCKIEPSKARKAVFDIVEMAMNDERLKGYELGYRKASELDASDDQNKTK